MFPAQKAAAILARLLSRGLFCALVFGKGTHIPFIAFPFDFSEIGAALSLVGIFLTVDAVRSNILKYPLRFEQWQNSY